MRIEFPINDDRDFAILLLDENDEVVDLSVYERIDVVLFYPDTKEMFLKFSDADGADNELEIVGDEILFTVKRSKSKAARLKDVNYTVRTYRTDTDYEEDKAAITSEPKYLFEFVENIGNDS